MTAWFHQFLSKATSWAMMTYVFVDPGVLLRKGLEPHYVGC